jgi:hypothetical protein
MQELANKNLPSNRIRGRNCGLGIVPESQYRIIHHGGKFLDKMERIG